MTVWELINELLRVSGQCLDKPVYIDQIISSKVTKVEIVHNSILISSEMPTVSMLKEKNQK